MGLDFQIEPSGDWNRSYVFISLLFSLFLSIILQRSLLFRVLFCFVWIFKNSQLLIAGLFNGSNTTKHASDKYICTEKKARWNEARFIVLQLFFNSHRSRFISFYFQLENILNRCIVEVQAKLFARFVEFFFMENLNSIAARQWNIRSFVMFKCKKKNNVKRCLYFQTQFFKLFN